MRATARLWLLVGLIAVSAACDEGQVVQEAAEPLAQFSRQLMIPVVNESNVPAQIIVAEDVPPPGKVVGIAQPNVVPPQTRLDVSFLVPDTNNWAIFVNPGPDMGPLLLASDLRGCFGRVGIEIGIGSRGDPYWSAPERWCGAANNP